MFISPVQSESAISIHINPPLESPSYSTPIPRLQIITEHWAELPVLYNSIPLAVRLTHGSVYRSMPLFRFIPPFPAFCVHKTVLYVHASIPAQRGSPSTAVSRITFPVTALSACVHVYISPLESRLLWKSSTVGSTSVSASVSILEMIPMEKGRTIWKWSLVAWIFNNSWESSRQVLWTNIYF